MRYPCEKHSPADAEYVQVFSEADLKVMRREIARICRKPWALGEPMSNAWDEAWHRHTVSLPPDEAAPEGEEEPRERELVIDYNWEKQKDRCDVYIRAVQTAVQKRNAEFDLIFERVGHARPAPMDEGDLAHLPRAYPDGDPPAEAIPEEDAPEEPEGRRDD